MTNKLEPCNVEPCRWAKGSCNVFSAQLAASVDLSVLALYGHIFVARRQCVQHYSGSVVAEILNIHWCHTENCCNNPKRMSLPNLSISPSWVCQGTFEFYRWNTADLVFSQILFSWSFSPEIESNKTQRFLGGSKLGAMSESPILMTMSSWRLVGSLVVIVISSVLSSFDFNKSLVIHVLLSLMPASTGNKHSIGVFSCWLFEITQCTSM